MLLANTFQLNDATIVKEVPKWDSFTPSAAHKKTIIFEHKIIPFIINEIKDEESGFKFKSQFLQNRKLAQLFKLIELE